jgi:hypothetical protein
MAKTQNLSLNPTKISGACGRLMCCLKYEQDAYEDAVKRVPKQESFVECPDGVGTVSAVNLLKEQVKVRLDDSTEQPKSYYTSEIRVIRSGKGKRPEDYVAPPPEELEKLRYIPPEEERQGRRFGDASDLSAALEQYLGTPADEEDKRAQGRKRRNRSKSGKKPEGQPVKREPAPQQQAARTQPNQGGKGPHSQPKKDQGGPEQPRKDQGKKSQGRQPQPRKEPAQPKMEQAASQPASTEGGETRPASKKRYYRPRYRKPRKPDGGQANG